MPDLLFRRLFLIAMITAFGLGAAASLISSAQFQPESPSPPGIVVTSGRDLMQHGSRFEVRGMNYYPKDYAWDWFWVNYVTATAQITTELDIAQEMNVNTVRIFLPYNLFIGSTPYLNYLEDFIYQLQKREMLGIITLFDFYPNHSPAPYASSDYLTNTRHIDSVINTIGITNPTVLAWDIKNELDRDYEHYTKTTVVAWANEMIRYTRNIDPNHLITLGFYGAVSTNNGLVYSPSIAAEFVPVVDFLSLHYFLSEKQFASDLLELQSLIGDKPVMLEEFGLHTWVNSPSDSHTEVEQAAYYNALLSLSEAYNVAGYLFWTLNDFSHLFPGIEEAHHCQGLLRNTMNPLDPPCEVTTTVDYSEKPAADTIRHHYADDVIYLDLFDAWVDPLTEKPPAGWSDNMVAGGLMMRGFNMSDTLWSQNPGKVAVAKFVSGSISIAGTAASPLFAGVDVDQHPFIVGEIYSYTVRDAMYGSDAILHVGVQEGSQVTRLLTITPDVSVPYTFTLDLRQSPTAWSGTHSFHIVLELVPVFPGNGYSATYELDWIALRSAVADLSLAHMDLPDSVLMGQPLTFTLTLTNNGPVTATGVTVRDTLPLSVTFNSVTPSQGSCSGTGLLVCNLDALKSHATAVITFTVTPVDVGDIINVANAAGAEFDSRPANNIAEQSTFIQNYKAYLPLIWNTSP